MRLIFLVLNLIAVLQVCKSEECGFPWQKVNDDICLFLTSITKTWDHANLLCNSYGGKMLYIRNDIEQKIIQKYLQKVIKYRFNRKPYIWLGANDQVSESNWVWSRNNLPVNYDNWQVGKHNLENSDELDCACFKPINGYWSDCDCSLTQHFTCRKPMSITESELLPGETESPDQQDKRSRQKFVFEDEEIADVSFVADALFTEKLEERSQSIRAEESVATEDSTTTAIAITTDEEQSTTSSSTTTTTTTELPSAVLLDLVLQTPEEMDRRSNEKLLKELVKTKMTQLRFRRPTYMQPEPIKVKTLLRQRVAKSDPVYSTYHCPHGYGYYLIEGSGCTKYKRCEDWNQNYVSLILDKCSRGVFDFTKKTCVPADQYVCDENTHVRFVAE